MSSATLGLRGRLESTVFMEFVVGVTGVMLVGFICFHLLGNLLLLGGPEHFNAYAARLHSLGEFLWILRAGLATAFVLHITTAIRLAALNRSKRGQRYAEHKWISRRTVASRSMAGSGLLLLFFLVLHLKHFTFGGASDYVHGLYGLVWTTFASPLYSLFYIAAMVMLGLHLTHATSSVFVTLGVLSDQQTRAVENGARIFGATIAIGFSIIPLFVLFNTYVLGVGG